MRQEIIELITRLCDNGTIRGGNARCDGLLDVGGAGTRYQEEQHYDFPALFAKYGVHYDMTDIRPEPGVDYVGDFTNLQLPKKFRTIICTEMLEHVKDPVSVVRNCYKHLLEGGIIVVTVPDMYGIHCGEDYWRFTENGLKMICEKFDMIDFGHFGSESSHDYEHYYVGKKPFNRYGANGIVCKQFNPAQIEFLESEASKKVIKKGE